MFQQMQAMAQKQVTVATLSTVSYMHVGSKTSNVRSTVLCDLLEILLLLSYFPAPCSIAVNCARHSASLCIYVLVL